MRTDNDWVESIGLYRYEVEGNGNVYYTEKSTYRIIYQVELP